MEGADRGSTRSQVNVITEAQPSYDEQFRARRKRYVWMMATRVPCLVGAVLLYRTPWLAIAVLLISIPLPWMAVLIANDGPAATRRRAHRGAFNTQPALEGPRAVIDAPAATSEAGAAATAGEDTAGPAP